MLKLANHTDPPAPKSVVLAQLLGGLQDREELGQTAETGLSATLERALQAEEQTGALFVATYLLLSASLTTHAIHSFKPTLSWHLSSARQSSYMIFCEVLLLEVLCPDESLRQSTW